MNISSWFVALSGVILGAGSPAFGQTSDILSTTSHAFPDRIIVVQRDTCAQLADVTFREYIQGVVKQEIEGAVNNPNRGLNTAQKIEALEAQALAAQTAYLTNSQCINKCDGLSTNVESSEYCQVFAAGPYTTNLQTAVTAVENQKLTLNGNRIGALFFDSTDGGFTINSEVEDGYYDPAERKHITPEFIAGQTGATRRHGMSQVGAVFMAGPGTAYNQNHSGILQHYYGPMCPAITKATLTQDGQVKFQRTWADNNNFTAADITAPGPTRTKATPTDTPLRAGSNATLEIEFNEQVISPGTGIEIVVGGKTLTGGVRTRPFPASPPEKWTFTMSPEFLASLPDGQVPAEVTANNRYATVLSIDSNPETMGFRDYAGGMHACDPGPDSTSIVFEKISYSSPTVGLVDTAQNGEPRPHGPFVGVANNMETRLWLHDIPRPDEEPGILFQAEGAPELRALEVGEVDAEGALVPEGRIWRTEAVGMFRSARLTSDAIPEGTSYGVLAEGGGGTGTTVYFGVDSTSPAVHYDLHVSANLSAYIKVTATDTVSGVKDIFLSYDWPNLMEDALVQVGTGAPNLPVMSETFQLPDRVPGQVEEFQGYLVA
ncbi:MAG: hypothetical protein HY924_10630, partial [Elusimicrobia bacterium]|nr:hypothetical protein [Elusimicrobiota bacterium]